MTKEKMIKMCNMIQNDMENDVKAFEGQTFNGRNVSTQFGNQAAAISALAEAIKGILEE